jgi:hypothetical protein
MTSQSGVGQTRIVLQFWALGLFAQRRGGRSCPPEVVDFGDSMERANLPGVFTNAI